MRALLRAEWLRQRRRPDLWVLPIVTVVIAAVGWYVGLTGSQDALQGPPGFPPPSDAAIAAARDPYAFPAAFHSLVGSAFLAFIAAVHFGASWTGSEFVRGTIRNIFLAFPTRLGFFVARLVALAALFAVIVAVLVAESFLLPLAGGVSPSGQVPAPTPAGLVVYAVAVWASLLFLVLVATTVAVLLRSGAAAVLVVAVYVVLELFVSSLPLWRQVGTLAWIPELLPGGRLIRAVIDVATATGFAPTPQPGDPTGRPVDVPPLIGLAILGAWVVVFAVVLLRRVRAMDILE
jgi:ABC-type transport system involved in multi-copper enzyme maturation permease subunit